MLFEQRLRRVRRLAAAFRVSAKTAAKWVGRYRQLGPAGLADRSSRPHHSPRADRFFLIRTRLLFFAGGHMPGYEIARRTGLSPASVSRILRRARLSRWRDLNPPPPVVRYEHPHPGDLLHLDIKGMTRFSEVCRRGDGRLRGKQKHPGFLALHVAIDDHSRLAFTQMLPDQKAETTVAFLATRHRLLRHATASACAPCSPTTAPATARSQFRQACSNADQTSPHQPYTPRTNGKAERFIQTALREWAYAKHWNDSEQRDAHLQPWTDYYNLERPHGSLNYKPPISRSDGTTS